MINVMWELQFLLQELEYWKLVLEIFIDLGISLP